MSLDIKSLKKLATTCRKYGIKHYKNADFEFTLSDDIPTKAPRASKGKKISNDTSDVAFESDTLSPEELMFWSSSATETTEGEA